MIAQIKLLTTTLVVTLLIWATADQSLIGTREILAIIEPVPSGRGDITITLDSRTLQPFRIRISGHKDGLDRFREDPLRIQLPVTRSPGSHTLDLVQELRQHAAAFRAVSVESVFPQTMQVIVDQTVRKTVPVRVLPGGLDYDIAPTVEPDEVTILIAESGWNRIRDTADAAVTVNAAQFLAGQLEGKLIRKEIPLVDPKLGDIPVRAEPDKLTLSASLREQRKVAALKAVPVRFESQIDIFNSFSIETREKEPLLTQSIRVKGPAEVIDKLVSGEIKVLGVIQFTANDTVEGVGFRYYTPAFHLPAGVELMDEPAPVELRLVRRVAPAPNK
jgi:hypothetical protein